MSLNPWSLLRIAGLLFVATGCAWAAGQYLDAHSFDKRNAGAIAICGALTPGMSADEAERRVGATGREVVVLENGNFFVRIPGQRLCFVEVVGGRVRSATVARSG
jgi:hypothetical protein